MVYYSLFREGNPVEIDGEVTFITKVNNVDGDYRYTVWGKGNCEYPLSRLYPVPLNDTVRKTYSFLNYEINDTRLPEEIVFSNDGAKITYNFDEAVCYVNDEKYSDVKYLHQIFNLVEECCGYKLPHFYPFINLTIPEIKPPFTIPVAPVE